MTESVAVSYAAGAGAGAAGGGGSADVRTPNSVVIHVLTPPSSPRPLFPAAAAAGVRSVPSSPLAASSAAATPINRESAAVDAAGSGGASPLRVSVPVEALPDIMNGSSAMNASGGGVTASTDEKLSITVQPPAPATPIRNERTGSLSTGSGGAAAGVDAVTPRSQSPAPLGGGGGGLSVPGKSPAPKTSAAAAAWKASPAYAARLERERLRRTVNEKAEHFVERKQFSKEFGIDDETFVDSVFRVFDVCGLGSVSVEEFIAANDKIDANSLSSSDIRVVVCAKIEYLFRVYDPDSSGTITVTELERVLMASAKENGLLLVASDIKLLTEQVLANIDSSGDTEISRSEFAAFILSDTKRAFTLVNAGFKVNTPPLLLAELKKKKKKRAKSTPPPPVGEVKDDREPLRPPPLLSAISEEPVSGESDPGSDSGSGGSGGSGNGNGSRHTRVHSAVELATSLMAASGKAVSRRSEAVEALRSLMLAGGDGVDKELEGVMARLDWKHERMFQSANPKPPLALNVSRATDNVQAFAKQQGMKWAAIVIWFIVMSGLWVWGYLSVYFGPVFAVGGHSACVARAFRHSLLVNLFLQPLTMSRHALAWIKQIPFIGLYLPVDYHTMFHKWIAYTMLLQVAGHIAGWISVFAHFVHVPVSPDELNAGLYPGASDGSDGPYGQRFTESFSWYTVTRSTAFVTGVIATISFLILGVASRRTTIVRNFELFWYTHHLFIVFYGALLYHGFGKLLGEPVLWKVMFVPLLIYSYGRVKRMVWSYLFPIRLSEVNLDNGVLRLCVARPFAYTCGQYVFVNCPEIAPLEWHPFTITSSPLMESLTMSIAADGNWKRELHRRFAKHTIPQVTINPAFNSKAKSRKSAVAVPAGVEASVRKRLKQLETERKSVLLATGAGGSRSLLAAAGVTASPVLSQRTLAPRGGAGAVSAAVGGHATPSVSDSKQFAFLDPELIHAEMLGQNQREVASLAARNRAVGIALSGAPRVYIDGPFAAPSQSWDDHDVVVLIGAGIGVTPFASVLLDMMLKHRQARDNLRLGLGAGTLLARVQKIHFLWVTRSQSSVEWFANLLRACSNDFDFHEMIDVQTYVTSARSHGDLRAWLLWEALTLVYEQTGVDLVTRLPGRTRWGRPDLDKIFTSLCRLHPGKKIGVYFCGAKALDKQIYAACQKYSTSETGMSVIPTAPAPPPSAAERVAVSDANPLKVPLSHFLSAYGGFPDEVLGVILLKISTQPQPSASTSSTGSAPSHSIVCDYWPGASAVRSQNHPILYGLNADPAFDADTLSCGGLAAAGASFFHVPVLPGPYTRAFRECTPAVVQRMVALDADARRTAAAADAAKYGGLEVPIPIFSAPNETAAGAESPTGRVRSAIHTILNSVRVIEVTAQVPSAAAVDPSGVTVPLRCHTYIEPESVAAATGAPARLAVVIVTLACVRQTVEGVIAAADKLRNPLLDACFDALMPVQPVAPPPDVKAATPPLAPDAPLPVSDMTKAVAYLYRQFSDTIYNPETTASTKGAGAAPDFTRAIEHACCVLDRRALTAITKMRRSFIQQTLNLHSWLLARARGNTVTEPVLWYTNVWLPLTLRVAHLSTLAELIRVRSCHAVPSRDECEWWSGWIGAAHRMLWACEDWIDEREPLLPAYLTSPHVRVSGGEPYRKIREVLWCRTADAVRAEESKRTAREAKRIAKYERELAELKRARAAAIARVADHTQLDAESIAAEKAAAAESRSAIADRERAIDAMIERQREAFSRRIQYVLLGPTVAAGMTGDKATWIKQFMLYAKDEDMGRGGYKPPTAAAMPNAIRVSFIPTIYRTIITLLQARMNAAISATASRAGAVAQRFIDSSVRRLRVVTAREFEALFSSDQQIADLIEIARCFPSLPPLSSVVDSDVAVWLYHTESYLSAPTAAADLSIVPSAVLAADIKSGDVVSRCEAILRSGRSYVPSDADIINIRSETDGAENHPLYEYVFRSTSVEFGWLHPGTASIISNTPLRREPFRDAQAALWFISLASYTHYTAPAPTTVTGADEKKELPLLPIATSGGGAVAASTGTATAAVAPAADRAVRPNGLLAAIDELIEAAQRGVMRHQTPVLIFTDMPEFESLLATFPIEESIPGGVPPEVYRKGNAWISRTPNRPYDYFGIRPASGVYPSERASRALLAVQRYMYARLSDWPFNAPIYAFIADVTNRREVFEAFQNIKMFTLQQNLTRLSLNDDAPKYSSGGLGQCSAVEEEVPRTSARRTGGRVGGYSEAMDEVMEMQQYGAPPSQRQQPDTTNSRFRGASTTATRLAPSQATITAGMPPLLTGVIAQPQANRPSPAALLAGAAALTPTPVAVVETKAPQTGGLGGIMGILARRTAIKAESDEDVDDGGWGDDGDDEAPRAPAQPQPLAVRQLPAESVHHTRPPEPYDPKRFESPDGPNLLARIRQGAALKKVDPQPAHVRAVPPALAATVAAAAAAAAAPAAAAVAAAGDSKSEAPATPSSPLEPPPQPQPSQPELPVPAAAPIVALSSRFGTDASNFDETFTREPVVDSVVPHSRLSETVSTEPDAFKDFTFSQNETKIMSSGEAAAGDWSQLPMPAAGQMPLPASSHAAPYDVKSTTPRGSLHSAASGRDYSSSGDGEATLADIRPAASTKIDAAQPELTPAVPIIHPVNEVLAPAPAASTFLAVAQPTTVATVGPDGTWAFAQSITANSAAATAAAEAAARAANAAADRAGPRPTGSPDVDSDYKSIVPTIRVVLKSGVDVAKTERIDFTASDDEPDEADAADDDADEPTTTKPKKVIPWTERSDDELKRLLSPDLFAALQLKKSKLAAEAERKAKLAKPEIDNVFADNENAFNGMSAASIFWENHWTKACTGAVSRAVSFLLFYLPAILLTYLALIFVSVTIILPACFVLLIVRTAIVERKVEGFAVRQLVLAAEPVCDKVFRVFRLVVRALPMILFLVGWPIVCVYVLIPRYGSSDRVIFGSVGLYVVIILLLQVLGTARSIVSFRLKKEAYAEKRAEEALEAGMMFTPPNFTPFKWKLPGNAIALVSLAVETIQLAMFSLKALETPAVAPAANPTAAPAPTASEDEAGTSGSQKFAKYLFLSFSQFFASNVHYVYAWAAIGLVLLLLAVFLVQLIRELRVFATLKASGNTKDANELFFHSFIGSIIYGHGELKGVTPAISVIVSLLSDTLFMVICEKLLLLVTCTAASDASGGISYLQINPSVVCWDGEHQLLAVLCLICFGFYLPLSAMIAPMLMEADPEAAEEKAKKDKERAEARERAKNGKKPKKIKSKTKKAKKVVTKVDPATGKSSESEVEVEVELTPAEAEAEELAAKKDVVIVKPFLSIITVSKCLMIVLATFFGRNSAEATILAQLFIMLALAIVTLRWAVLTHAEFELGRFGLAEPCLPPAVNVWRVYIFIAGGAGALVAAIAYQFSGTFAGDLKLALLFAVMIVTAIPFVIWYRRWESKHSFLWAPPPSPYTVVDVPLRKFEFTPRKPEKAAPAEVAPAEVADDDWQ